MLFGGPNVFQVIWSPHSNGLWYTICFDIVFILRVSYRQLFCYLPVSLRTFKTFFLLSLFRTIRSLAIHCKYFRNLICALDDSETKTSVPCSKYFFVRMLNIVTFYSNICLQNFHRKVSGVALILTRIFLFIRYISKKDNALPSIIRIRNTHCFIIDSFIQYILFSYAGTLIGTIFYKQIHIYGYVVSLRLNSWCAVKSDILGCAGGE